MKIVVKKLRGGEYSLDVNPDTCILQIKQQIAEKLHISVDDQKLLLMGRTLADDQTVQFYPTIKEGTKLNLVVKKPESLYDASVKQFKKMGMNDSKATTAANRLLKIVQDKFNKLSWDDIDRLSLDCLIDEKGYLDNTLQKEIENDDLYAIQP